jgi:hypothetical protein
VPQTTPRGRLAHLVLARVVGDLVPECDRGEDLDVARRQRREGAQRVASGQLVVRVGAGLVVECAHRIGEGQLVALRCALAKVRRLSPRDPAQPQAEGSSQGRAGAWPEPTSLDRTPGADDALLKRILDMAQGDAARDQDGAEHAALGVDRLDGRVHRRELHLGRMLDALAAPTCGARSPCFAARRSIVVNRGTIGGRIDFLAYM